jgi:hypothetical protein
MGCWRILAVSSSQPGPSSSRSTSGDVCCYCFHPVVKIIQPELRVRFSVKSARCLRWCYRPTKFTHRFHLWRRIRQVVSTFRTDLFTCRHRHLLSCGKARFNHWHFVFWRTSSHYAAILQCSSSPAWVPTKLWSATAASTLLLPPSVASSSQSHLEPSS